MKANTTLKRRSRMLLTRITCQISGRGRKRPREVGEAGKEEGGCLMITRTTRMIIRCACVVGGGRPRNGVSCLKAREDGVYIGEGRR